MDMWRPFTNSIAQWARNCRIVCDKFHVLQHANKAIDKVRRDKLMFLSQSGSTKEGIAPVTCRP